VFAGVSLQCEHAHMGGHEFSSGGVKSRL